MRSPREPQGAFTLIELLVVIGIIAILVGLLFPAFKAVQNQAKSTQAKNDLTQIVNAVNAFYTDYGMYPLAPTNDTTYGSTTIANNDLFYTLRAVASGANAGDAKNPRKIAFISPPDVKNPTSPRSGIATQAAGSVAAGEFVDPWGTTYKIRIDGTYDNQVTNPYSLNAGAAPNLSIGVIAWSFGTDAQSQSLPGPAADKNAGTNSDDVISWQ
jgi:prepilin-type N-terminal cleavage/methylation domain-containing protein